MPSSICTVAGCRLLPFSSTPLYLLMYYFSFFLFLTKDEEGRSGPFIDRVREQEKLEKTTYIKDIENALGAIRYATRKRFYDLLCPQ